MFLAAVRTNPALAGEHFAMAGDSLRSGLYLGPGTRPFSAAPMIGIPSDYQALDLTVDKAFPSESFRPRGRSILEQGLPVGGRVEPPLINNGTVWQRLSEYRTRDRVRVLTLWETGGSSVSLQAGKRGDPSLQWTSRLMGRGGATHRLLDALFSKSLGAVLGRGQHTASRSSTLQAPGKSERFLEGGGIP